MLVTLNIKNETKKDSLTNSPTHTHGIKVRLQNGDVGRVQQIL